MSNTLFMKTTHMDSKPHLMSWHVIVLSKGSNEFWQRLWVCVNNGGRVTEMERTKNWLRTVHH